VSESITPCTTAKDSVSLHRCFGTQAKRKLAGQHEQGVAGVFHQTAFHYFGQQSLHRTFDIVRFSRKGAKDARKGVCSTAKSRLNPQRHAQSEIQTVIPLLRKILCDKSRWNGFGAQGDLEGVKYREVFHQFESLRDHLNPW